MHKLVTVLAVLVGVASAFVFGMSAASWMDFDITIPGKAVATLAGIVVFLAVLISFLLAIHTLYEFVRYKNARNLMGGMVLEYWQDWRLLSLLLAIGLLFLPLFGIKAACVAVLWVSVLLLSVGYIYGRGRVMNSVGDLFYR